MKRLILAAIFVITGCGTCRNYDNPAKPEHLSVVVLGDSYSTYSGCIPAGYSNWYPHSNNDVDDVRQTWWKNLCARNGYKLLLNSSYSGSTICNIGYDGYDYSDRSFVSRMKTDIATEDGSVPACGGIPDLVLIFGGTNDSWAGSPMGGFVLPENWRTANLNQCIPATCYMAGYLREKLPNARIILIINTELSEDIHTQFPLIAREYGIEALQLHDIDKQAGHPSKAGMTAIANQLAAYLKN